MLSPISVVYCCLLKIFSVSLFGLIDVSQDSPMREPAEQFLTMRAFGAPPVVIALAAQGTFRGFKDTKTPLYAVGKYQRYRITSLIYIKQIQVKSLLTSCA